MQRANMKNGLSCPYSQRKIVYIAIGMTGSGKTARVNALVHKHSGFGLRCKIISTEDRVPKPDKDSYHTVNSAVVECIKDLDDSLSDDSIRRIFIDDCNLASDIRNGYIEVCIKNEVEWVLLVVGKFTREFAEHCAVHNRRGVTLEELRGELVHWGDLYSGALRECHKVRFIKGVEKTRIMRDTCIIAYIRGDDGAPNVRLGIRSDGSYRKGYRFVTELDAEIFYQKASSVEFQAILERASWYDFKTSMGSFKPVTL